MQFMGKEQSIKGSEQGDETLSQLFGKYETNSIQNEKMSTRSRRNTKQKLVEAEKCCGDFFSKNDLKILPSDNGMPLPQDVQKPTVHVDDNKCNALPQPTKGLFSNPSAAMLGKRGDVRRTAD